MRKKSLAQARYKGQYRDNKCHSIDDIFSVKYSISISNYKKAKEE